MKTSHLWHQLFLLTVSYSPSGPCLLFWLVSEKLVGRAGCIWGSRFLTCGLYSQLQFLSVLLSVCLHLCLSLPLFVSLYVSFSTYLSICLSWSRSVAVCVWLSVSIFLSFFVFLSIFCFSGCFFISLLFCLCLSVCHPLVIFF